MREFEFGKYLFRFYNKDYNPRTGHNTSTTCVVRNRDDVKFVIQRQALCHKKDQHKYSWKIGQRVVLKKVLDQIEGFKDNRLMRIDVFDTYNHALELFRINQMYDNESGRCSVCNEDTLWGDAPHTKDCEFAKEMKGK